VGAVSIVYRGEPIADDPLATIIGAAVDDENLHVTECLAAHRAQATCKRLV
jgi:hypothetical protein